MTDEDYTNRLREIETEAQVKLDKAMTQARAQIVIPQSRRVRYTHLIDAIVAMIVEPAREQIESEMKAASEAVERAYYQEQGLNLVDDLDPEVGTLFPEILQEQRASTVASPAEAKRWVEGYEACVAGSQLKSIDAHLHNGGLIIMANAVSGMSTQRRITESEALLLKNALNAAFNRAT